MPHLSSFCRPILASVWRLPRCIAFKFYLVGLVLVGSASAESQSTGTTPPNVLLIVVDDVGYSDLGCYGGEIETENLDRLAWQGIRFSEFHVNPMCVVTRTSLLTGHTHSQSDHYRRSRPIAHFMRAAGYQTSIVGKWHQPGNPLDWGFDSFYGFLGGAINSWTGKEGSRHAIQRDRELPKSVSPNWYATDAFTDEAMRQMESSVAEQKPFFCYLAYNAPHTPLHAPKHLVEKYYQRYQSGWQTLREDRYQRMRSMGLIDERYVMSPPGGEVRRWSELPDSIQMQESRRMSAYAGMLECVDWNVGKLMQRLDDLDVADDTLVIFLADNGAAYSNGDIRTYDEQIPWERDSAPFSSNGWAYLKNTPFRWYKSSAHEGGVSVPLIVKWPNGISHPSGSILKQRIHVTNLFPTLLELVGQTFPSSINDRKLAPLYGVTFLDILRGKDLGDEANAVETSSEIIQKEMFWSFNQTSRGLTSGDWKIVSISDGPWKLFQITEDPCESKDLAKSNLNQLQRMRRRWFEFASNETKMPESWRRPVKPFQEGWGFHRFRMAIPDYLRCEPAMAATNVPLKTSLQFHFSSAVSFAKTRGKTIRLYEASNVDHPIWQSDPEPGHTGDGAHHVTFDDLPLLQPNTTYFALADHGWIHIGGKPARALNDGAYWYRFRTGGESQQSRSDRH